MRHTWIPLEDTYHPNLAERVSERLQSELESWQGTRYSPGQQCKKAGVDCVRFVCAILDHLKGRPLSKGIPNLPQDASMHDREGAIKAMKVIRTLYMPNLSVKDGTLEPGDVVVTGPHDGGPGHALIVGAQPNQLWHSTGVGVQRSGLGALRTTHFPRIFKTYRMMDKASWAR